MRLLSKIVDLVDRDIAANSKPLSIIFAAVPFVPFMLFVKGAPVDRAPVLSAVALALSFAWLAFIGWRMIRRTKIELRQLRGNKVSKKANKVG